MKFLDVVGKSSTISSLPDKMNIDDIESAIEEPLQVTQPFEAWNTSSTSEQSVSEASLSPSQQQPKPKKSRNCNNISDVKEAILSALEDGSRNKPDAVDGFFLQIGDRVRVLPARERGLFEMKVQSLLFEFEQELSLL
ncbi:PREDICTED: uncharacterized protein LOC105562181 [Vollenhovia emeryi]|uniref:uncharacterized protein LOC105562181 n=1 Tax=Vollenhovia emeryi TaxID=411798 RepID=UPI0005F536E3|nr:PREDICTED: uncharacterized protein LOC105562181 [Vollenhovia emeryi]